MFCGGQVLCIFRIMLPPGNFYAGCVKYKTCLHCENFSSSLTVYMSCAKLSSRKTFLNYISYYDIMREAITNCALPIIMFTVSISYLCCCCGDVVVAMAALLAIIALLYGTSVQKVVAKTLTIDC